MSVQIDGLTWYQPGCSTWVRRMPSHARPASWSSDAGMPPSPSIEADSGLSAVAFFAALAALS